MTSFFQTWGTVGFYAMLILALAAVGATVYAIIHALRTPEDAFRAAGKWQKNYWLIVLVVCLLVALLSWPFQWLVGLLGSLIGALVYLLDARPKLDEVRRPRY